MLEANCVGDNFKMLVTVLAILITHIHYVFILASGTNIRKMSPTSKLLVTKITTGESQTELCCFKICIDLSLWTWDEIELIDVPIEQFLKSHKMTLFLSMVVETSHVIWKIRWIIEKET